MNKKVVRRATYNNPYRYERTVRKNCIYVTGSYYRNGVMVIFDVYVKENSTKGYMEAFTPSGYTYTTNIDSDYSRKGMATVCSNFTFKCMQSEL